MAGIHLHRHDLLHEGPEAIRPYLARMNDLSQLFVQVNDIFERNSSPVGTLERNPVEGVILGSGRLYADLDLASLSPQLAQQVGTDPADDPLAIVSASTLVDDYQVVPWLNIADGAWTGDVDGNGVVDYRGRPVDRWLCPNGPQVALMWGRVISALVQRYSFRTFLIDRIRYPDWGGEQVRPANLLSCICAQCCSLMSDQDIDVVAVREQMTAIADLVGAGAFEAAGDRLATEPLIQRWLRFRQQSVRTLVEAIVRNVGEREPDVQVWLDLWPPSYAWILGQDYAALTELSPRLKHFPYHRLGGGADMQSLIDAVAHDEAERERAFAAFVRLFGLDYGADVRAVPRRWLPDPAGRGSEPPRPRALPAWHLHPLRRADVESAT